jgi:hypothetical protein
MKPKSSLRQRSGRRRRRRNCSYEGDIFYIPAADLAAVI